MPPSPHHPLHLCCVPTPSKPPPLHAPAWQQHRVTVCRHSVCLLQILGAVRGRDPLISNTGVKSVPIPAACTLPLRWLDLKGFPGCCSKTVCSAPIAFCPHSVMASTGKQGSSRGATHRVTAVRFTDPRLQHVHITIWGGETSRIGECAK